MDSFQITKENCKGYCELFEAHHFNDKENTRIIKNSAAAYTVILFALIIYQSMGIPLVFIEFSCLATISFIGYAVTRNKIDLSNKKKKIAKKYPNIDTKIKFDELELALVKANILNYTDKKRENYNLRTFDLENVQDEIVYKSAMPISLDSEKEKVIKIGQKRL